MVVGAGAAVRFLRRLIEGAEYRSGLGNPEPWLVDALGGASTWSGQRVTAERAVQVPAVRGAISLISWAVSLCPLKVYRDAEDGSQISAEEHRAWPMLHDKPNEYIPADTYWQLVTRQLLKHGNSFHEKQRNLVTGLVDALAPIPPHKVTVKVTAAGEKTYEVWDQQAGRPRVFGPNDVLHIMGDTDDGLIGRAPLEDCREAIGAALARMEFEASFYRRGAVLSGVIQHPSRLGDVARDNLRKAFGSRYAGSRQAHGTPVLEEGATYQTTGASLEQLQFNESEQRTRTDVALLFNIPPGFLAGSTGDSLTYATVEGNQIQFAQFAVAPWANRIAKAISADRSIFPFQSWYAEFVLEGLMRGDASSRADQYSKLFALVDEDGRRAIDVNEIRALENRRPARAKPQPELPAAPAEDTSTEPGVLNVRQLRG